MIRKMQILKSKRGFTMIELIVVIAIIGVMAATILIGSGNRREKIQEANTAASDFYSAIQAEFTNFQIFDGPLTMRLYEQYRDSSKYTNIGRGHNYGGMMYYYSLGGNYPYMGYESGDEPMSLDFYPRDGVLYVEMYAFGGTLRRVSYANDLADLLAMTGTSENKDADLCLVLEMEMKERLEYREGYYYARISYTVPEPADGEISVTEFDRRTTPIRVDWAAYCSKELTDPDETFLRANMLTDNGVCGVVTTTEDTNTFKMLGTTGTSFASAGTLSTDP